MFNRNFTAREIDGVISSLKNNKAAGIDGIPAEFIKCSRYETIEDMCNILNYIIEQRQFPDIWSEGLRTSIYKSGDKYNPDNYRGLTVLPVFEKIFETAIQKRLEYVNKVFERNDVFNGGFLKGSRTTDNIFILQSLIERQLNLGQTLIVCFVDFSKAFDLINRNILFYKITKSGLRGRVIDTLRDLYKKTTFRVKLNGKVSDPINQKTGVNQGGNASPIIFREYLADLKNYLDEQSGVCMADAEISEMILLHLLWADDLVLISSTAKGTQRQLDGLENFGRKNQTTVNGIKTKIAVFGKPITANFTFKGKPLEQVKHYKYVGCVFKAIQRPTGDIFSDNYTCLYDKASKAMYNMKRKLRPIGELPPSCMFYLFDSCIKPIIIYGSDVWGVNKRGREVADKLFMWYMRSVLKVKATTCNIMTVGECGVLPPSVSCVINCVLFFLRLRDMPGHSLAHVAFLEQRRLHDLGFSTWYGRVSELANHYGIDLNNNYHKSEIKSIVRHFFINSWLHSVQDTISRPILRTYALMKSNFNTETYLLKVKNRKYRSAISKLRTSSHTLEIERGRYTHPKTPVDSRLCVHCDEIEDEIHFVTECTLYSEERSILYDRINYKYPNFHVLRKHDAFVFLMTMNEDYLLTLLGKFLHKAFNKRALIYNQS